MSIFNNYSILFTYLVAAYVIGGEHCWALRPKKEEKDNGEREGSDGWGSKMGHWLHRPLHLFFLSWHPWSPWFLSCLSGSGFFFLLFFQFSVSVLYFLCLILFLRFICLFRMILRSVNRRKMLNLIGKPRLVILFFPVRDLFLGCFICEFRVPSSFFFLFPIRFRISNF